MWMKTPTTQLFAMHARMLKAQKDGGDFDLTIRDLMEIWNYPTSTSSARYHIPKLIEMGLVKVKCTGRRHVYRAVDIQR